MSRITEGRLGKLICNLLIALLMLAIARVAFIVANYDKYAETMSLELLKGIACGGLTFDLAALFYINSLYIVLFLFPLHFKERRGYHLGLKWLFVITNGIAMAANLCDCVYVRFTGRRTTATVFSEFSHESNLAGIFGNEILHNLPLVVLAIVVIWGVWKLYQTPRTDRSDEGLVWYYVKMALSLVVAALCAITAIRGGIGQTVRPISISNANQYVDRPIEAAAVLNTPFSIIRTIGKPAFNIPEYMPAEEAERYYSPVHYPIDSIGTKRQMNVVIFIVESFSRGFIGALNTDIQNGEYKGYTPFTDSLINVSRTYKYAFANGMKSIDGMPSVLSSIPMMIEPFFLTPASMNHIGGIAHELKSEGYYSAFFHGAPNGSMGFEAFARSSGFDDYFGLNEYCKSAEHNGMDDFDGSWAIWDEEFFQYFAEEMSHFKQPFVTALFSASSHHPFHVPARYADIYPEEGGHPNFKCIRYVDMALQRFFERAKHEPWFANTLFVITCDHSSDAVSTIKGANYGNDQQQFAAPIIFYAPADSTLRGTDTSTLAQQIDIMPTVLGYLGYDKPYVAFGIDLFNTPAEKAFTFNYLAGTYQYARGDYFLQFDGTDTKAIYNFRNDKTLTHNLLDSLPSDSVKAMEMELKSIIQQYAERMRNDQLTYRHQSN